MIRFSSFYAFYLFITLLSCAASAQTYETGYGPHPHLPKETHSLIPTVNMAATKPWPANRTPIAAKGLAVNAFASELDHPRWIYVLPNNDVLVAETNAPPKPEDSKGIKGFFMKLAMKYAGAATESANRITLLRDSDGDGIAETRTTFLKNLHSPFGMALVGNDFYVANTDAVIKFDYKPGATEINSPGKKLIDLPAGVINHHWTKSMIADRKGKYLYVTVGSNSNVGENGLDKEVNRAAILQVDRQTGHMEVFATGLRNPNGMGWQPQSGELWTAVNERDELGDDLVPDYMTSVKQGGFYGWPFSYYGQHIDARVKEQNPELVKKALEPDYALGAHTASLGLTFYEGGLFPQHYLNGAFIGQHGSWNRKPRSGYKVIFVPFKNGKPSGPPEDVLTGFIDNEDDKAMGRPVGVAFDQKGTLLVADDVGNIIWRVSPSAKE